MHILVDSSLNILGYGFIPDPPPNCFVYDVDNSEQEKFTISGYKSLDLKTMTITVIPVTVVATPKPPDPNIANKQAVVTALVANIGQTVTAETVQALLTYLGNLP